MVNTNNWKKIAGAFFFLLKDVLGAASIILILCLLFYVETLLGSGSV